MEYNSVNDSGKRQEFTTGSVRDTQEGKGRFDLMSPIALDRLAKHLQHGADKYGDRNWEKGQPLSRYLDSTLRHINKFMEGYRDEDHMSAALWNISGLIHTEEMIKRGFLPPELNDLPHYYPESPVRGPYDRRLDGDEVCLNPPDLDAPDPYEPLTHNPLVPCSDEEWERITENGGED